MRIKRIKSIRVNSTTFNIEWDRQPGMRGGSFDYDEKLLILPAAKGEDDHCFMVLCHELQEICAEEMRVRHRRSDCDSDYIFVLDHRQFTTMTEMFTGLLLQFIE